jgi:hypothetical protein
MLPRTPPVLATHATFSGSPNGFWVVAGLIAAAFASAAVILFRFRFKFF